MCRSDRPEQAATTLHSKDATTPDASLESDSLMSSDDDYDDEDLLVSSHAEDDDSHIMQESTCKKTQDASDDLPIWMTCGRTFVFLGIFLAGVLVSAITFVSLTKLAHATYEATYAAAVQTIELSATTSMASLLESAQALSDSLATTAASQEQDGEAGFPLVTLDTFYEQASLVLSAMASPTVLWTPLLKSPNDVASWNSYVASELDENADIVSPIVFDNLTSPVPADTLPMAPVWQVYPMQQGLVNFNLLSIKGMTEVMRHVNIAQEPLLTETLSYSFLDALSVIHQNATSSSMGNRTAPPTSLLVCPVLQQDQLAGLVQVVVPWEHLLQEPLEGIVVVLANTCGEQYTYELHENGTASLLGVRDLHDDSYDDMQVVIPLTSGAPEASNYTCSYTLTVYSSDAFYSLHMNKLPYTVTFIMAFIFIVFVLVFVAYDHLVARHNLEISRGAQKADQILSSLFPSHIKDRLMKSSSGQEGMNGNSSHHRKTSGTTNNLAGFFANDGQDVLDFGCKPIADLFPETTVLFADIAGFTAWSSVREPAQVFILLETIFNAFDESAKRRRVYKVETVGDCYVAVTGVPNQRADHAVAMCRFAKDAMKSFHKLSRQLETKLGPDTGDLDLRVGIHSGQVTGGVLRGERSRFQLFGDTMNTAARMEQSGMKGKIHLSQETVDLLIAAGKTQWITPRQDTVVAKGKGELRTYWLTIGSSDAGTVVSGSDTGSNRDMDDMSVASVSEEKTKVSPAVVSKTTRLIEWNCEVLIRLLKQIVVRRKILQKRNPNRRADADESKFGETSVIDEVQEIISIPSAMFGNVLQESDAFVLSANVVDQLFDYVSNIAAMYRDNPFHNFEHASHVTMSVTKLLSRIVAPTDLSSAEETLHDHTYGITSDPLTQFACVLSALIHDVDHPGVPNAQLLKENAQIASYYKGKSMAEQNSVDLAWHLLMDEAYVDLRQTIYTTQDGLNRFRQLIVNSVMATDIMDKDLKTLRNKRWDIAFSPDTIDANPRDTVNRKATIVIEHLIQASDVAHTMQHWHVYRRWNERFYDECYKAYKEGRAEKDPTESWYQGELGFYDFYIIPLAKKLKDCGVFGVASDEYLNYAMRNRKEWEERGQEVVQEMVQRVQTKYN